MSRFFILGLLVILVNTSTSQTIEKDFIEVEGYAKLSVEPDLYNVVITIQEPEQRINYTIIGKTPIDSVKLFMSEALRKFGVALKDLNVLGSTSRETFSGQSPFSLTSIVYSLKMKDKEQAQKIVNELRFNGLKGIVMNWSTTEEKKAALRDSLYGLALKDAQKAATMLASKLKRTVGEIKNLSIITSDMNRLDKDFSYDLYNNFRFEYDNKDVVIKTSLRVRFELN